MDTKFSDGQAGVDALTSSLNTRMHAQAAGQGTAGASLRQEGDALEQAVDVFYRRVMEDPSLEPFFREIDMERQRHKMSTFVLYILGGEEAYTGRDMWEVHRRMVEEQGLRRRHFDAVLQHVKGTLEEMRAPADVSAHAVHVIQSTLPQFHFPPDDDDQGGSQQAGGAAPLAAQLRVLPGGDAVALRLMQSGASSSPGDAAAQAAAPAPPGFPSKPATEPTGSAGAGRQGAFPSGEQCLAVGLPADSGKGGGPAAAAHSAGEPPAEAAGQPVSLAAAAAPAGGAAGSAAAAQPARRRPHLDWVPADLADMLASEDPSVRMGALFILPEPRSPRGCGGSRTRQQLVQLARERWAMLSAGLLAGPGLLAGVAVWAAAAALVGAHLMAALASPGPPGPRQ